MKFLGSRQILRVVKGATFVIPILVMITVMLDVMFFPSSNTRAVDQYQKFLEVLSDRKDSLLDHCQTMKINPSERFTFNFENLIFLPKNNVMWCPVFKAASTTFSQKLLDIAISPEIRAEYGDSVIRTPTEFLKRIASPIKSAQDLTQARQDHPELKNVIIVRHPFDRLVSAFRDKLERLHTHDMDKDYFYKHYGKDIVKRYRTAAIRIFGKEVFSEENNYGALLPVPDKDRVREMPIFWEFIQYVLDMPHSNKDEHWVPAYYYCSVCMIKYDAIIKMENLDTEGPMLERFLGIDGAFPMSRGSYESRFNKQPMINSNLTQKEITELYMSTLRDEDIERLMAAYGNEFKIFGYSYDPPIKD